jgi:hypothetical protein
LISRISQNKIYLGNGYGYNNNNSNNNNEYTSRLRMVMKSVLNSKNKVAAIDIPFWYNYLESRRNKEIDTKTIKIPRVYNMHHPKAEIGRLCRKKRKKEEAACFKLKRHTKQR